MPSHFMPSTLCATSCAPASLESLLEHLPGELMAMRFLQVLPRRCTDLNPAPPMIEKMTIALQIALVDDTQFC